ncbi:hypothetical protein Ancab_005981 [Ancistrocladus abbreviatus]
MKLVADTEKRRQKSSTKTNETSRDAANTRSGEFSKANEDNVHEKVASEQLSLFKLGMDLSAKTMGFHDSQQSFGPYGPVTQVHDKAIEDTGRDTERSPSTSTPIEVYEQPFPVGKSIHNRAIGAALHDRDMNDALDGKIKPMKTHRRVKKMEEILNLRLSQRGNGRIKKKAGRKLHGAKAEKAMAPS